MSWLKNLIFELGFTCNKPPVLLCDNLSALYMCTNSVFHNRSKHIEIDYRFVREKVEQGLLTVPYVPTQDQYGISSQKHYSRHFLFISVTSSMSVHYCWAWKGILRINNCNIITIVFELSSGWHLVYILEFQSHVNSSISDLM